MDRPRLALGGLVAVLVGVALIVLLVLPGPVTAPSPTAAAGSGPGVAGLSPSAAAISPSPVGAASPRVTGGSAFVTPSPSATASPEGSGARPGIRIDSSLLALLPATVGASAVTEDRDREAQLADDRALAVYVGAVAAATVADTGENIAVITLAERRPTVDVTEWLPRYRADFNAAACDPLGGSGSPSSQRIGGRDVEATSCAEGGAVYHLVVDGGSTILSVFELGPGGFGRTLIERLDPGA